MHLSPDDDGVVSEINVTPFVDVMLVLLVIFMVTAPMMQSDLDVELPKTTTVEAVPEDTPHVVLSIGADGRLMLDETDTTDDALPSLLTERVTTPGRTLFLRADAGVPYGRVVRVLGLVRGAGVSRMHVMAEEEEAGS